MKNYVNVLNEGFNTYFKKLNESKTDIDNNKVKRINEILTQYNIGLLFLGKVDTSMHPELYTEYPNEPDIIVYKFKPLTPDLVDWAKEHEEIEGSEYNGAVHLTEEEVDNGFPDVFYDANVPEDIEEEFFDLIFE